MDKFFIAPAHTETPLFYSFDEKAPIPLFADKLPENFFKTVATAADLKEASVIVLPNNFTKVNTSVEAYIKYYADLGAQHRKRVFLFSCGDYTDTLMFDSRVYVFKYSLYRSVIRLREISTPTLTEDLGKEGIILRQKREKPVVSFCGKADFSSLREQIAGWLKRIRIELLAVTNPLIRARIRGIFWRMCAINACKNSNLIETNFIIRKSFSGAEKTIELDPVQARKEFVNSVINADFILTPKGDGNYSNRFLEALSMGRVPVLIDTDTVLPFEGEIDYSKIVVRVPMSEVQNIPSFIKNFYDSLDDKEWIERQQLARWVYENFLRQDKFFENYFSKLQS